MAAQEWVKKVKLLVQYYKLGCRAMIWLRR